MEKYEKHDNHWLFLAKTSKISSTIVRGFGGSAIASEVKTSTNKKTKAAILGTELGSHLAWKG